MHINPSTPQSEPLPPALREVWYYYRQLVIKDFNRQFYNEHKFWTTFRKLKTKGVSKKELRLFEKNFISANGYHQQREKVIYAHYLHFIAPAKNVGFAVDIGGFRQ